eukprot:316108_1
MSVTVINNVAYIKCGRKPSNKQLGQALMRRTLIIRCIIVPLIDGPHLSIVNGNWYFKCTFWNDANITEDRSIEFLLSKNLSDKSITALVSGISIIIFIRSNTIICNVNNINIPTIYARHKVPITWDENYGIYESE